MKINQLKFTPVFRSLKKLGKNFNEKNLNRFEFVIDEPKPDGKGRKLDKFV